MLTDEQKAEIERLQNDCKECASNSREWFEILRTEFAKKKSEAIKEFSERLKAYFNDGKDVMYLQTIIHYGIDKIAKEMEGGTDE